MKSQIPKINRSHSQPQPSRTKSCSKSSLDQPQRLKGKPSNEENAKIEKQPIPLKENPLDSEVFKDALSVDNFKDSTTVSISQKESMTPRSSVSGIPLPVRSSTSRMSSKDSPRYNLDSKTSDTRSTCSTTKRSLELQFLTKKKRMENLKKELELKQKPLLDIYHSLSLLKKKLEESGKHVPLENIKFLSYGDMERNTTIMEHPIVSAGGEVIKSTKTLDPGYLNKLRYEMDPIPTTFQQLGDCMIDKTKEYLTLLHKMKESPLTKEQIMKEIERINEENRNLEKTIEEAVERQVDRIDRIYDEVGMLCQKGGVIISDEMVVELETKLKHQEKVLMEVNAELAKTQQQLKETKDGKEGVNNKLHDENVSLKDRIKILETEVQTKKKKMTDHSFNVKNYETKIEILTKQVHDLEKTKREAEGKVNELNGHMRSLQTKLKGVEQKWKDEKEEIMKSHKGEHAILEKLTNERQALDTRVNLMNNILDEQKRTNDAEQARLRRETANAKDEFSSVNVEKQILQDKLDSMQQEVARLSVQQQQAVDVIKNTIDPEQNIDGCKFMSEREAQLKTELLATRVALKAAQERIESYTAEKMRFIDSIEKLNGDSANNMDTIGKSLVQKEEIITRLEQEKKEAARMIENQSMVISQLNAKIDNLQAGVVVNNLDNIPHDTQELKIMLEEGKSKLQRALTKSLENEQKLIKYEHDLNQQKKQLNDMDNLLKVRDGLIGMLKAKKDELLMENESLHRYSEEIRQLLFETKEELKQKSEAIQDLSGNLDNKGRICFKLEKKIKDLESTLSETNEKRYKLQDTVGSMEKELQTTKAHINQIAEMQTRYAIGMQSTDTDVSTNYVKSEKDNADEEVSSPRCKKNKNNVHPNQNVKQGLELGDSLSRGEKIEFVENKNEGEVNDSMFFGDAQATYLREMYYYVNVSPYGIKNYTNYVKKVSPLTTNPLYKRYNTSYYEPLTKSLVTFGPTHKIQGEKINSLPVLQKSRKNAKIQTSQPRKTTSFTQTDVDKKVKFLVRPDCNCKSTSEDTSIFNAQEPYKICCDILAKENATDEPNELSDCKLKERQEFINVVNKLSEFDNRKRREELGLGKEFNPIVFGGVSRYKVMNSGSLMWCRPSKEMHLNNMLITKDILAHSSHKIKK